MLVDGDASRLPPGPLRDAFVRSRTTRSSPEGTFLFEFDRLKPPFGVVAATARGYEFAIRRVEFHRPSDRSPQQGLQAALDFQLGFAGVISGTVRDRISAAGARGMALAAQSHQPGTSPMMMGTSEQLPAALADAEGRYSIQGLSPGEYWVAPKTGYSDYVSVISQKGRKVTLEAGSEITNLDSKSPLQRSPFKSVCHAHERQHWIPGTPPSR